MKKTLMAVMASVALGMSAGAFAGEQIQLAAAIGSGATTTTAVGTATTTTAATATANMIAAGIIGAAGIAAMAETQSTVEHGK